MAMFNVALICLNGHVINRRSEKFPEFNTLFCELCGSKSVDTCLSCKASIKGDYNVTWMAADAIPPYKAPSFCANCGLPFPWTKTKLAAVQELIEASEGNEKDKQAISQDVEALVHESPRMRAAVVRFKSLLPKLGVQMASAVRDIVVDVSSEAVKRLLIGP